jgi:hypothetical protein
MQAEILDSKQKTAEILVIRNNKVHSLYDVAFVDFEAEQGQYLQQFLSFEEAVESRLHFIRTIFGEVEEESEADNQDTIT